MTNTVHLQILSQPEFTRVGRMLLGSLWEESQEAYESFWLGLESPQLSRGKIFLLGAMDSDHPVARLALWKPLQGESLFFLYARERSLPPEAVESFLSAVKDFAKGKGVNALTGPMAFSTWHPYRFISRMGDAAFFPGEQKMPEEDYSDFIRCGFSTIAEYRSTWVPDLRASISVGDSMGVKQRLAAIEVKTLTGQDLPTLLPEIHRVSSEIFQDNFAYMPIALRDFLTLSSGEKGIEAVLIMVMVAGKTAGFGYGYDIGFYTGEPGHLPRKTAVLKTLGVLPEYRSLGLGYGLAYLFHAFWLDRDYEGLIHAYMKTDNRSLDMSGLVAKPIRAYALMKGTVHGE